MAGMNLGLQKHTIKKKLRNRGINPDQIDLEAKLDSTLSLPENIQNLEDKYGRMERTGKNYRSRQNRAQAQRRKQAKQEAEQFNKQRPKYNRYVDATKDAETTFADPTERQMKKWKNNPNKYDIKGVDDRQPAERRPQTELPIRRSRNVIYSGGKNELRKSMRKIPGSIKSNVEGRKERLAQKIRDQGGSKLYNTKTEMAVPQNALISNFDVPDVVEEDRQRVKDKEAMLEFEREERLQAREGSEASKILKDKRDIGTVGKKMKGTTTGRSNQESLRDGYASKESEKTLNKWKGNYL